MSAQPSKPPVRFHAAELLDDIVLRWAHHHALMSGGDGWAVIVSPRWRELAERYATWPDRFPTREDGTDLVMFKDGQEGITFCAKALPVDSELDEITDAWVIMP